MLRCSQYLFSTTTLGKKCLLAISITQGTQNKAIYRVSRECCGVDSARWPSKGVLCPYIGSTLLANNMWAIDTTSCPIIYVSTARILGGIKSAFSAATASPHQSCARNCIRLLLRLVSNLAKGLAGKVDCSGHTSNCKKFLISRKAVKFALQFSG